ALSSRGSQGLLEPTPLITGAAFVDLSAAYDTVQHRLLIKKLFDLTAAAKLCNIIRCLLSNRMFHVTLNNKKSRWFHQNNGLPQGSVLAPLLFNVYTNDQPLPEGCSRFIYADDLAITTQQHTFPEVESTLERGLSDMSAYYLENHLRPNPGKTQICSFHLKNREAKRELNVTWDGIGLENHQHPVYLGVTLDRTLIRPSCVRVWFG
uniref:Reverse transcriptase domain-containing protein n=1 Tax=Hippocampus comes TaxID=109280 RepID=A0A3Q3E6Q2_HIPCM